MTPLLFLSRCPSVLKWRSASYSIYTVSYYIAVGWLRTIHDYLTNSLKLKNTGARKARSSWLYWQSTKIGQMNLWWHEAGDELPLEGTSNWKGKGTSFWKASSSVLFLALGVFQCCRSVNLYICDVWNLPCLCHVSTLFWNTGNIFTLCKQGIEHMDLLMLLQSKPCILI